MKKFETEFSKTLNFLKDKFVTVSNDMFWISGILQFKNEYEYFIQTSDKFGDVEFNLSNIENISESTKENSPITEKYLIQLL